MLLRPLLFFVPVIFHTCGALKVEISYIPFSLAVTILSLFFLMSGYFLTWRLGVEDYPDYRTLIRRKCSTLLLPYLFWNLLLFLLHYTLRFYGRFLPFLPQEQETAVPFWRALWLASGFCPDAPFPIMAPLWFVRNLFLMFLLAPLFVWFVRLKYSILFILCFCAVEICYYSPICYYTPICGLSMFLLGMTAGFRKYDFCSFTDRHWWLAPALLVPVFIYPFWQILPVEVMRLLATSALMILFVQLSAFSEKIKSERTKNFLGFLSTSSFFLYCAHSPVVSTLGRVVDALFGERSYAMSCLLIIPLSICCIVIVLSVYVVLERTVPGFLSFLNGGRKSHVKR